MGTVILVAVVMLLEGPLEDFIGTLVGRGIEFMTTLLHCIFSWMLEHLTEAFVIGCDMYEEEFVISVLNYSRGIMVRIATVILVIIAMWQLMKTFLAFAGLNGEIEEPWKVGIKIFVFATLLRSSYGLCQVIITGPVDKAVNMMLSIETKVEKGNIKKVAENKNDSSKNKKLYVADNFDVVMEDGYKNTGLFFAVAKFVIVVFVDYKILMFILSLVQKYVNMIIYIMLSPIAFACGVSRSTSYVLGSWIRSFVGGIAMQLFQIALLRVLNAYGSVIGAANKFNWSLIFIYLAACLGTDKIEEILGEMGLSGGIRLNFSIGNNFNIIGRKLMGKIKGA